MAEQNTNKIYIAGLSWSTDERQLRDMFSNFGTIESIELVKDNYTGQSRGFGFIVYSDPESAKRALTLHGYILDRRPLTVALAVELTNDERRARRDAKREIDIKTQAYGPKHRSRAKSE